MPETQEGLTFDELGICQACQSSEQKIHINWVERERVLRMLLEDAKARLICLCAVDDAGAQLLKAGDEQAVLQMDSADTAALYDSCWDHVGFAVKKSTENDAKN